MSDTHTRLGALVVKSWSRVFGATGCECFESVVRTYLVPYSWANSGFAHEACYAMEPADFVASLQCGMDGRCTVGPAALHVLLADQRGQSNILERVLRVTATEPGVETGARDLQRRAHQTDREDLRVLEHELESQLRSFAK